MKRTVLAAALCSVLAAAGCGSGSGSSSDSILLGAIAGTTGAYGSTGQAVFNATKMAVAEINAKGGIDGKKVVFEGYDDGASATTSSQLFNKLLSKGAVAIVGSPDTGPTTASLADQKKIPVLGAVDDGGLTIYPDGPDKDPHAWAFSTSLNTFAWGGALADYAIKNCQKLAIVHDPSDYGKGGRAGFEQEYEKQGKKIDLISAVTENWSTGATVGLKSEIEKIRSAGIDCVDVWLTPQDQASFMQEANALGAKFTVLGNDETSADATFGDLAKTQGDGMVSALLTTDVTPSPRLAKFQADYKAKYGVASTPFAELSYDAVYILKQAIEAGKSTKPQAIRDQLNKITDFDGLTGKLTFTEKQHTTINADQLTVVKFDAKSKAWVPAA
ncbi:ABC transporter substrate-binding protein [Cryptosporangium sp. NPDC051539]|uniref:ABC transporter substrate-binding protein n=1 Tax=Cryptosporangium sp. NPDC051539 TaxID=3363962 RepID=UPI0037874082